MGFGKQLKQILKQNNMTVADLAIILGKSKQNLNQQILRDNFSERDIKYICDTIGYSYKIVLTKIE